MKEHKIITMNLVFCVALRLRRVQLLLQTLSAHRGLLWRDPVLNSALEGKLAGAPPLPEQAFRLSQGSLCLRVEPEAGVPLIVPHYISVLEAEVGGGETEVCSDAVRRKLKSFVWFCSDLWAPGVRSVVGRYRLERHQAVVTFSLLAEVQVSLKVFLSLCECNVLWRAGVLEITCGCSQVRTKQDTQQMSLNSEACFLMNQLGNWKKTNQHLRW